jgi:hypothetical protein
MAKVAGSTKTQTPAPKVQTNGGFSGKVIGTKPIRSVSGPSINSKPVGPKNAPYHGK